MKEKKKCEEKNWFWTEMHLKGADIKIASIWNDAFFHNRPTPNTPNDWF